MIVGKFTLAPVGDVLPMPRGAKPLHVHDQGGHVCLWALIDPNAETVDHRVEIWPTGLERDPSGLLYLGTVHLPDLSQRRLVLHVFYGGELS